MHQAIDIYTRNNIFQHIQVIRHNRKKRYQHKEFFVEGVRNINEAIANGWHIKSLVYGHGKLSDWASQIIRTTDTDINYCLNGELLDELSGKTDTSELIAIVQMKEETLDHQIWQDNPFLVLFDRPSNKGNLGTMIRSCDALGVDMLFLTGHSVDLYDPDVIAATMGSFFRLSVVRISDYQSLYDFLAEAKRNYPEFKMVGTTAHSRKAIDQEDLSVPLMLMIGNETLGLNHTYKSLCDTLCTIPMDENSGASSFNVSCAASIMMYEVTRQRRRK